MSKDEPSQASTWTEEILRRAHARRWVAERTIGWLSQSRRMSKDIESGCMRRARP